MAMSRIADTLGTTLHCISIFCCLVLKNSLDGLTAWIAFAFEKCGHTGVNAFDVRLHANMIGMHCVVRVLISLSIISFFYPKCSPLGKTYASGRVMEV